MIKKYFVYTCIFVFLKVATQLNANDIVDNSYILLYELSFHQMPLINFLKKNNSDMTRLTNNCYKLINNTKNQKILFSFLEEIQKNIDNHTTDFMFNFTDQVSFSNIQVSKMTNADFIGSYKSGKLSVGDIFKKGINLTDEYVSYNDTQNILHFFIPNLFILNLKIKDESAIIKLLNEKIKSMQK